MKGYNAYRIGVYEAVRNLPYESTQIRKKIEAVTTIFQHGKTQMPAQLRKSLNLKDGDKIVWITQDGKWMIEKA